MSERRSLNERALEVVRELKIRADEWNLTVATMANGATLLDVGVERRGGLQAGLALARICLADLASVELLPGDIDGIPCPQIQVHSDQPVLACMASQYAGWRIAVGKFFAMGSGPMRAALGSEALFDHLPGRERPPVAVGVLETAKLPSEAVTDSLAAQLQLPASQLTLVAARTASIAGTIQVVARALETALHKLHELKFDLRQVVSGYGVAPLPPVAANDLAGIGTTNDAILYGGRVVLWVDAEDDAISSIGPRVPSSASADHGVPFADIFERYQRDFYQIDAMLFSPAVIVFQNVRSGRSQVFGRTEPALLRRSFFSA